MTETSTQQSGAPAVSVVVPVYNVKRFLQRSLDSLAGQTMGEIEFILVDDGSTDGSGEVCDQYARKDSRFRVIHQKNAGSGAAYNAGLDAARGEYIGLCEPDDYVDAQMYENLYAKASLNRVDVVKSLYKVFFDEIDPEVLPAGARKDYMAYLVSKKAGDPAKIVKNNFDDVPDLMNSRIEEKDKFLLFSFISKHPSIWSALYRRAFIGENGIRFNESPGAAGQDNGFAFLVFCYFKSLYLYGEAFYNYNEGNVSASSNQGINTPLKYLGEKFYVQEQIKQRKIPIEFAEFEALSSFLHVRQYLIVTGMCRTLADKRLYLSKAAPLFAGYYEMCADNRFLQNKELFKKYAFHPGRTAFLDWLYQLVTRAVGRRTRLVDRLLRQ